jgi:hypothetical protein
MGLYEGIKDVAKIVQQADNIDLYRQLIDLSSQALDMQSEIVRLTTEVKELRKEKEIEKHIVRYKELFVTLEDKPEIRYCSHCLDFDKKLIQIQCYDSGEFRCPHCQTVGIYDKALNDNAIAKRIASNQNRRSNHW